MAKVVDSFWKQKRVFVTGHTGFKGSWLCLWLQKMGATVSGYSLAPATKPSLFEEIKLAAGMESFFGDVRDAAQLLQRLQSFKPEIVLHLAAQPLVRTSYAEPLQTYATNVMGTAHLLEAVRQTPSVRAVLNVTTDKCYENREWHWGYQETDSLGGYDPYSSSKACSEIVTAAYRRSYFHPDTFAKHGVAIASARAGNVIGGGDWSPDRLVPDIIRSILRNDKIQIRNPNAIRPWQHVLEPLAGYLILSQKLIENGTKYSQAYNFGPPEAEAKTVGWIVQNLTQKWAYKQPVEIVESSLHEATYLKLDCSKAMQELQWKPKWSVDECLDLIVDWNKSRGSSPENLMEKSLSQIDLYQAVSR